MVMARPANAAAKAAPTMLLSLALLLCTVAVGPAAAASSGRTMLAATPATSVSPFARRVQAMAGKLTGDEDTTNLRITYLGESPVPAGSKGVGAIYCFEVSHFGGAGAGQCDPAASACCTTDATAPAVKITSLQAFISTECAAVMAKELPGFKVTLTPMPGAGQAASITKRKPAVPSMNVRAGTGRISTVFQGAAELCVFVPEKRLNGPCGSMEKLCGPDGCAFVATTAPFKHSGAKTWTTCSLTADVPVASDACSSSPCDPNANCTNSPVGSFTCVCQDGYSGDGKNCTQILACDLLNITVSAGSARCSSADTLDWSLPFDANVALSASIFISLAAPAAGASLTDATTPFYYSSSLNGVGSFSAVGSARKGYATASYRPGPSAPSCSSSFQETNASVTTSPAAPFDAGKSHTCVLNANGSVSCMGYNNVGQLGLRDTTNRLVPTLVQDLGSDVQALAGGDQHTCALKTDGRVYCTGANSFGQLGLGDTSSRNVPNLVNSLGSDVQAIAAGGEHTCALKTDGSVFGTGGNGNGQLGLGGTVTTRKNFTLVAAFGSDVQAIAAGKEHTCVLKTNGTVWCTGANGFGQLGLGDVNTRRVPNFVERLGSGNVKAIAAGYTHTCALHKNGSVSCMGNNADGQLGLGDTTSRNVPTLVNSLGSDVQALAGGEYHTCAVKTSGSVFCTGQNINGQLGLGDTAARSNFTLVPSVQAKLPTDVFATVLDASGKAWPLKLRLNLDVECAQT